MDSRPKQNAENTYLGSLSVGLAFGGTERVEQSHDVNVAWEQGKAYALSRNVAPGVGVPNDFGVGTNQAQDAAYNEMLSTSQRGQLPIQQHHGFATGFAALQQQQYQYDLIGATPVGFQGIIQDLMPHMTSHEAHLNRQMQIQLQQVQVQQQIQLQLQLMQEAGVNVVENTAAVPSALEFGGAMRQQPQLQDRIAMIPPYSLRYAMGGDE